MNNINPPFQEIIAAGKPVLADFYADWCGPCQMLSPVLKEVKDTLGDRIAIVKINTDDNPEAANHYRIKNVPTIMLFQNGKLLWRHSGVLSKMEIIEILFEKVTWPELPCKPI